jgi:hypothetical protein
MPLEENQSSQTPRLLKKILAKISKAHRPQIAVGGKSNFPVPP